MVHINLDMPGFFIVLYEVRTPLKTASIRLPVYGQMDEMSGTSSRHRGVSVVYPAGKRPIGKL